MKRGREPLLKTGQDLRLSMSALTPHENLTSRSSLELPVIESELIRMKLLVSVMIQMHFFLFA